MGSSAASILARFGERVEQIEFVGNGATCSVWRVRSGRRSYALRVVDDERRVLDGGIDGFVRSLIQAGGGRIAEAVSSSDELGRLSDGRRWSLDVFVSGTHPARRALPATVCRQLGETLAALHGVPVERFGRPSRLECATVIGRTRDPVEGVKQRFENPFPAMWQEGYRHPLLSITPDVAPSILERLEDVSDIVGDGNGVLCHSDLHEGQLICTNDALAALIDFGDATILDRHWDLGSVLYFHGHAVATSVYHAYRANVGTAAAVSMDSVSAFSIAVAMHHASRSTLPGKSHRLGHAARHVRQLVSR